jgi:V8-like Glu-specific endopeptidase
LFSHTGTHVNESCTGTLIAPNVVLSAGHCFDTNIMDAFYLGQGVAVQSGDTDWE